jgi:hypothetical protein
MKTHALGIHRNSAESNTTMGCKGSRVQISASRPLFSLNWLDSCTHLYTQPEATLG